MAQAKKAAPPDDAPAIQIHSLGTEMLVVPIRGTAPLLVHRFSEKAKRQMLDNMQGRKSPKEPKDPHGEYLAAGSGAARRGRRGMAGLVWFGLAGESGDGWVRRGTARQGRHG